MFRQTIARIFCILTVFMLSGNVVSSAGPLSKAAEKSLNKRQRTISPYIEADQDSTFLAEKDPLEGFDFYLPAAVSDRIVFVDQAESAQQKHYCRLNGLHTQSGPIWLWVKHMLI